MRVGRANERAGERTGEIDIGHESSTAGQKAPVLDAAQRGADALIILHATTDPLAPWSMFALHAGSSSPRALSKSRAELYSISSRTKSSRSNADLSVTMKRPAWPP